VLDGGPVNPPFDCRMSVRQRLGVDAVYAREDSDLVTVNATDGSPFVVPQAAVPDVRLFALRVLSDRGSVKIKMTGGAGTDQSFLVSQRVLVHSPQDGYSAIKIVGSADVEYLVAGP
jgi:hypothetical protein